MMVGSLLFSIAGTASQQTMNCYLNLQDPRQEGPVLWGYYGNAYWSQNYSSAQSDCLRDRRARFEKVLAVLIYDRGAQFDPVRSDFFALLRVPLKRSTCDARRSEARHPSFVGELALGKSFLLD